MINANSILFVEKPYACVVKKSEKVHTCSFCFKQKINVEDQKLHGCSQCNTNYYCNVECQRSDWKLHKVECKSLSNIPPNNHLDDIAMLIFRLIIRQSKLEDFRRYLIINNCQIKPREFSQLATNLDKNDEIMNTEFANCFRNLKTFAKYAAIEIENLASISIIKEIFAKCITNNFEIQNEYHTVIGYGCFLNGSSLNHSCWPNAYYKFERNKMILIAMKDVTRGDEITINYIDTRQLREDRQNRLQIQYMFKCECEACLDDNLEKEMSQLFCVNETCRGTVQRKNEIHFQCDSCLNLVPTKHHNMRLEMCKAKEHHLNNLIKTGEYRKAYELSKQEFEKFPQLTSDLSKCGLYQLGFGEIVFESAIFNEDYGAAYGVATLSKLPRKSWISEKMVRFLGSENHLLVQEHLQKYKKLLQFCD